VARTAARRAGEGSRGRLNDGPIFPDLARPPLWATSQPAEAEDVKVAFPCGQVNDGSWSEAALLQG
jgi:hypothetical protein